MAVINTSSTSVRSTSISRGEVLRKNVWRFAITAFALFVAAILVMIAWFYSVGHAALPQLDGSLKVLGLSADVKVIRDQHGMVTIEASNLNDLFFAQGYVTAQDRLWQMDGMRRAASGELAEVFGSSLLKRDRRQRILGFREVAKKSLQMASADERGRLEAYARGVNTYIESHRKQLPLEFRLLGYAPKPWTPEDSLLIAVQMADNLTVSPRDALAREKIAAKLGPDLAADLYVNTSTHDRPPTVSRNQSANTHENDDEDEDQDIDFGPDTSVAQKSGELPFLNNGAYEDFPVNGSNNWAISGAHTVTGKPLLSNDPHLGHQMPNLWYAAHLRCGNFDVAGVTLPGLPYVILGHNQKIAWGVTALEPTISEIYVETFNKDGEYLTPDGWRQPEHRFERIALKGKPDGIDVITTRHGPIISSLIPGEARMLALRWTLYDGLHDPFFKLNSAQTWQDFRSAVSELNAPGLNFVYADTDGNIGYQAVGDFPIHASDDGGLPVNGTDNAHEWRGYIPFEKLPSIFNPPYGIVATANSRVTPNKYPYSLSAEWVAPWRTERIYRVLESGRKFSADDMLALQNDIYSELNRYFAEKFAAAVDHAQNPSAQAKEAAEILRQWDGRMSADSTAATIAVKARTELQRLLLEPKLGPAPKNEKDEESSTMLSWKSYHWTMQTIWLENAVKREPKRWLPGGYANYAELLTSALEAALNDQHKFTDSNFWRWGKFNPLEIQHPVLGKIPILNRWTGPGVQEQSGSSDTIKAVTRVHGPSERMTIDLSNLDQSTLNLVTGESGNFFSPYYMDQWKTWFEGSTFQMPFSANATRQSKAHELTLKAN